MVEMGVGYSVHPKLVGRLVIPIREEGLVVYYVARLLTTDTPLLAKEIGPKNSDGFMNRGEVVYGLDEVHAGMVVVVVEGIFDSERLRRCRIDNTCSVALLGSHLSDIQLGKILSKKPKKIVLMFDGDEAGRTGAYLAKVKISKRFRGLLSIIYMKDGQDPDDLDEKTIKIILARD
jgi:DNA primase